MGHQKRQPEPLDWCLAHGKITPEQYATGKRFRCLYEEVERCGLRAVDYTIAKVDGVWVPHARDACEAATVLRVAYRELGQSQASLLKVLVGQGRPMADVAQEMAQQLQEPVRETAAHVRLALKTALDALGQHWAEEMETA